MCIHSPWNPFMKIDVSEKSNVLKSNLMCMCVIYIHMRVCWDNCPSPLWREKKQKLAEEEDERDWAHNYNRESYYTRSGNYLTWDINLHIGRESVRVCRHVVCAMPWDVWSMCKLNLNKEIFWYAWQLHIRAQWHVHVVPVDIRGVDIL